MKSDKKELILLGIGLSITMCLAVRHYFSSIPGNLRNNKDIAIAVIEKKPKLLLYRPLPPSAKLMLPGKMRLDMKGTDYQKARTILEGFSCAPVHGTVLYVNNETARINPHDFLNLINAAKGDLKNFFKLAGIFLMLKKSAASNIPLHDLIIIFFETVKINSLDVFINEPSRDFAARLPAFGEVSPEKGGTETGMERFHAETHAGGSDAPKPKVEVLNASGKKALAMETAKFLRKSGFDVINFANYSGIEKETLIINYSRNASDAKKLKDVLNLERLEIYSKFDKLKIADIVLILGTDFDEKTIK